MKEDKVAAGALLKEIQGLEGAVVDLGPVEAEDQEVDPVEVEDQAPEEVGMLPKGVEYQILSPPAKSVVFKWRISTNDEHSATKDGESTHA